MPRLWRCAACAVAALVAGTGDSRAQSAENLLLVVNAASAASVQIGEHYARVRAVPNDHILGITVETADEISRATYERQIESPIAQWLERRGAHDRTLYIILVKGIPLRIAGTGGRSGTGGSVDSELTLLYRKLAGRIVPPAGPVPNPYFLGERPPADAVRFTHRAFDIFLVSRLDGFSVPDVIALIDRGSRPSQTGRIALDETVSPDVPAPNRWLRRSADLMRSAGLEARVLIDASASAAAGDTDLLGYFSWGSNDPARTERHLNLRFVPGALAGSFVSSDARSFTPPPDEWTLGRWDDARTYYAGSPQSLLGDLIHDGITGTAGHVAEPYLDSTLRPDVLFPAYLAGFNLVESFYLAMPSLGWQSVVIGDPLCAPFRAAPLASSDIEGGLDAATGLPALFSAHALAAMARGTPITDAHRALLRANVSITRGDPDAARRALVDATTLDGRMVEAHLRLGMLDDQAGDHAAAIESYRRVIARAPDHAVALNNLAYDLAVHMRTPEQALPYAQRAYALTSGAVSMTDTLAWIRHLLGEHAEARRLIEAAVTADAGNAGLALHAALIAAADGAYDAAARALAQAVSLNARIGQRQDAQQLALLLGGRTSP